MPEKIIELKEITKAYKTGSVVTPVLHGVSLSIERGEFVAIMGPSGSGKSTLMNIVGLLDRPTSGSYAFASTDVSRLSDNGQAFLRAQEIGFIFQSFHLLPRTSAEENVVLPLLYGNAPIAERNDRARAALDSVGLSHRLGNHPSQLSGGEKQRVAVARALVNRPALLLADEPTGNLDSVSGEGVLKLFQKLHKAGNTIVMITHEQEAAEFAERIVRIRDGKIASDEKVENQRTALFSK